VAKKEEFVKLQADIEIRNIQRDQEGKNIDLRHENAELRMTVNKQNEQMVSRNLRN
jgi:hypothetical protein